jgi:hypothetical protein
MFFVVHLSKMANYTGAFATQPGLIFELRLQPGTLQTLDNDGTHWPVGKIANVLR